MTERSGAIPWLLVALAPGVVVLRAEAGVSRAILVHQRLSKVKD